MALFQRHQLQQEGDSYNLILYLDPSMTEFASDLGSNKNGAQEKLETSVKGYVKEKFPNLKVKAAKIMLGSMMVATIPLAGMTAQAAEGPTQAPTVISAPATTTQGQLPDVQNTKYASSVNDLTTLGVIAGKDDGKYHAEDQLSRAEFAKFAVYAAGFGAESEALVAPTTGFGDVAKDYWGAKYIKMAKDKGLMEGIGNNQFNPTGNISYEEVVTVLLRLQGYSNEHMTGTWPANYVNQAQQSGITANSDFAQGKLANRGDAAVILHNSIFKPTVTFNATTNQFESAGADATIFNKVFGDQFMLDNGKIVAMDQAPVGITNTVTSTAKSFRIVFNKPVKDADNAAFTVTRNGINVSLTPTWSADKRTVELTSTAKLLAGDYTVKLSGIETTGAKESTITVQAEKITSIELAGEKMVQNKTNKAIATMSYQVFNQYGDNVTKDPIARDIQWTSSVAGSTTDDNLGKLTLTADRNLTVDEKIVITGIDSATGSVITKTVTVGEMANITDFRFGDFKYPEGTNKVFAGVSEAVRIPFTAVDQYGNTITDLGDLRNAVQLLDNVDNTRFDFAQADSGGVDVVFDSSGLTNNQKVVLTVVSSSTGATKNITFDVVKQAAPATIEMTAITKTVAADDAAGSLVIPITVTDQFGNNLSADQIVNNAGKFSISATGALQNAGLQIATSGAHKGKIVNMNAIPSTPKGASVIVVTVPETGKSANISVNIRDARVLSDIISPEKVTNNLISGATYDFGFQFRDQYGEVLTNPQDNANLNYKVKVEKVSGDNGALTFALKSGGTLNEADVDNPGSTNLNETLLTDNNIRVSAVDGKTGTYRITAQLLDKTNNVVSQSAITFNNVEATGALTYELTGIPNTIFGGTGAGAETAYAVPLTVTAKDSLGREYVVNTADIVSVGSNNDALVYDDGKLYGSLGASDPTTVTATLTVNFNTKEEVKSITKEITVTKAATVLDTFAFYDSWYVDATDPGNPVTSTDLFNTVFTGATKITTLTGEVNTSAHTADINGLLVGKDQFGVYTVADSGNIASVSLTNLVGIDRTKGASASVDDGVVSLTNIHLTGTGDHTARLIVTATNGKVTYYTINLEAAP